MNFFQLVRSDYKKHRSYGGHFLVIVFFTQGFWATFQYRIAHSIYDGVKWQPFRGILLAIMLFWQKAIEVFAGISVPASCKIGHSFYIGHFGGIILNAQAVIGNNCNIGQGVTIGISGQGEKRGVPIIGNNVFIGVNSVVAGKITVGNDVLIGACSLVRETIQDHLTVLGVPAAVVSANGSKGYI